MRLRDLADQTPGSRDRYVDFLRAFSILTVVVGHWLIAVVIHSHQRVGVVSAIGLTRGLWLATWLLQVMPLFFFVGGFSNRSGWESTVRDGGGFREFFGRRAARLLRPAAVFAGLWLAAQIVMHAVGFGGEEVIRGSFVPFGPLWFLVVYLGVVAATPFMLRMHDRYGVAVPMTLLAVVVGVDALRFAAEVPLVGWVNLAAVWLFAHQLGFFYADGTLRSASRGGLGMMALAGLASLVLLTNAADYPRSMIGTDVERLSNMNPPTVCIAALTLWLVALAMLARPVVLGWLQRPRAWRAVVAANAAIMTMFLWHLTAYLLAIMALKPLGLGLQRATNGRWWLERPAFVLVPAVILAAFVAVFARFERGRISAPGSTRASKG